MALKMVINGANVTHQTSNGFTVSQKLNPATTLNILGVLHSGDDMSVMQATASLNCPENVQGAGYMGIEVFNSSNNSVLSLEYKRKLGVATPTGSRVSLSLTLLVGPVESIDPEFESEGRKHGKVFMSPTNYSTGKIRLTFSGKIPPNSSLLISPSVQSPENTVGDILGMPGLSGHAEVEIDFSVVTV